MKKRQTWLCRICKTNRVNRHKATCKKCFKESKHRVAADNAKMLEWSVKEFGKQQTYFSILAEHGIEVLI